MTDTRDVLAAPVCQHEACTDVYDSDTPDSAPVIAIAWALAERSADGPHGSNERRRFRPLARAFLHDLLRDPRRAAAVRDFLNARLDAMPDHVLVERAELERLREALSVIRDMEPEPVELPSHPADCAECASWKGHPVQRGTCDARYRELHARDDRAKANRMALGYRMRTVARAALTRQDAER